MSESLRCFETPICNTHLHVAHLRCEVNGCQIEIHAAALQQF